MHFVLGLLFVAFIVLRNALRAILWAGFSIGLGFGIDWLCPQLGLTTSCLIAALSVVAVMTSSSSQRTLREILSDQIRQAEANETGPRFCIDMPRPRRRKRESV